MGTFPGDIQRTTRTLPGTTGGVRTELDVSTGEAAKARAVSQLGGAIFDIGIKFDIIEADTQLTKAKRLAKEEINRLAASFNTNDEPATYQAELDKSLDTIQGLAPKNRRAAAEFDSWYQDRVPQWQKGVEGSKKARADDNFKAEGFLSQQQAISTGNVKDYLVHLETGKTLGVYSAEQAERLGMDVVVKADYNTALNAIQIDPANVEEVLKGHPNLTATQRVALRHEAWSIQTNRRLKEERERKELYERTEKEAWKMLEEDTLTKEWLKNNIDSLSKVDRNSFSDILDAQVELEKKQRLAAEKIMKAADKDEAGRLIVKGIDAGTMSEFIISSAAEAYDFSPAEYEGYLKALRDRQIIPYEPQAELIGLTTGVQVDEVEPDEVKTKINKLIQNSIATGLPKDKVVALGLHYRERLAAAIKAGEENRSGAYLKTKARTLMEQLIRDKDPISGMYTDDQRQILAAAEAIIRLETYIDDASKTDKPLKGTELLIKAMEIGRDAKKMVEEEKKAGIPQIFRPLRRTEKSAKKRLESKTQEPKKYKYTATNPKTGEKVGSNDGVKWKPIR